MEGDWKWWGKKRVEAIRRERIKARAQTAACQSVESTEG